jgi:hypothetical protein
MTLLQDADVREALGIYGSRRSAAKCSKGFPPRSGSER